MAIRKLRRSISRRASEDVFHPLEILESRMMLSSTPTGLTPAQALQAYGFSNISFASGGKTITGNGAGQTIAIVDAYQETTITSDLDVFDKIFSENGTQSLYSQYGAASSVLTIDSVNAQKSTDSGWALETALDVEWAHAITPAAKIVLVEAANDSISSLLAAVNVARNISGVSVVSMSWGGSDPSNEAALDSYFTTPTGHQGVTFVASAGDSGASSSWPSSSDYVVSVGGTTLTTSSSGNYISEAAWSDSGGGYSRTELEPSYQSSVNTTGYRSTPDVAYDANPSSGFAVYTATAQSGQTGWFEVGGTSAGAPQWAALIAIADQGRALQGKTTLDGGTQTLPTLYSLSASDFHDITTGANGYRATTGYDLTTGRGSPIANLVVSGLVASNTTVKMTTVSGASTSRSPGRSQFPFGVPFGNRFDAVNSQSGEFVDLTTVAFIANQATPSTAAPQNDVDNIMLARASKFVVSRGATTIEARLEDPILPPSTDNIIPSDVSLAILSAVPVNDDASATLSLTAATDTSPDAAISIVLAPPPCAAPSKLPNQADPIEHITEQVILAPTPVKESSISNAIRLSLLALPIFAWTRKRGKKRSHEAQCVE